MNSKDPDQTEQVENHIYSITYCICLYQFLATGSKLSAEIWYEGVFGDNLRIIAYFETVHTFRNISSDIHILIWNVRCNLY